MGDGMSEAPTATPPPADGLRGRALRGAAWSVLQNALTQVCSIAVVMVLGRHIAPAEYGLVALAQLVIQFLMVFLEQGFSEALVQRRELTREDADTAFWSVAGMGVFLALLANLLAGPFAAWQGEPRLEAMMRALSAGFVIISLRTVPEAMLLREMRMGTLAVRQLGSTVLAGAVGVGGALAGWGAWSVVAQTLTISTAGSLILWVLSPWRPGLRVSRASLRSLLGFGSHVMGNNIITYGNRRLDQWLIEAFHGKVALGYYQMAQRWVEVQSALLGQALNQVSFSSFARVQREPARMGRGYVQATRLGAGVGLPMLAGLAVTAPDVLHLLVGPNWLAAAPMLAVLAAGAMVQLLNPLNAAVLLSCGRPSWRTWINLLSLVANSALFLLTAPLGPVWMAAAYSARAWLLAPVQWVLVHRLIRPDWLEFTRGFGGPLLASAGMAGAVHALRGMAWLAAWPAFPRLAACALAGAGVYAVLLRVVSPATWTALRGVAAHLVQRRARAASS